MAITYLTVLDHKIPHNPAFLEFPDSLLHPCNDLSHSWGRRVNDFMFHIAKAFTTQLIKSSSVANVTNLRPTSLHNAEQSVGFRLTAGSRPLGARDLVAPLAGRGLASSSTTVLQMASTPFHPRKILGRQPFGEGSPRGTGCRLPHCSDRPLCASIQLNPDLPSLPPPCPCRKPSSATRCDAIPHRTQG
jgi:hypothetical protein